MVEFQSEKTQYWAIIIAIIGHFWTFSWLCFSDNNFRDTIHEDARLAMIRRERSLTKVTSRKSSSSLMSEKADVMLVWKSFQRRQNCSVDILECPPQPAIWNGGEEWFSEEWFNLKSNAGKEGPLTKLCKVVETWHLMIQGII